jgi:hypothetical protein
MCGLFAQERIMACAVVSMLVLVILNIYNFYYVNKYVISVDAMVDVPIK